MGTMRTRRHRHRPTRHRFNMCGYLVPRLTRPMRRSLHAAIQALAQIEGPWPLRVLRLTAKGGTLVIGGLPDAIKVQVSLGDLILEVESEGQVWDYLLSLDVFPQKIKGGWACADERCRGHKLFPDLKPLLIDHWRTPLSNWLARLPEHPVLLWSGGLEEGFKNARLVDRSAISDS